MEPLAPLTSENIASVLQSLLAESTKDTEGSYTDHRARLAFLRQAIKCCELFLEHERYNAIESRLDRMEGFVADIKAGMHLPDADEYIRSRQNYGILEN